VLAVAGLVDGQVDAAGQGHEGHEEGMQGAWRDAPKAPKKLWLGREGQALLLPPLLLLLAGASLPLQHSAALLAMLERDSDAGVRQAVVQTLGKGDRRRLVKELEDLSAIFAVHPTDLDRWTVWLAGPAEGPYSAGVWELSVTFPPEYPYRPPTIFFVTPIYHPFVCQTSGKLAGLLDRKTWSPALQMRVILYSLHSMLVDVKADAFEPCWSENKLMQSMIQQLASDRADFDRVARKWTQAHAVGASHFLRSCSPAIRRRALYLMWVARQLEALHGLPADALLDPWVEFVVPLCVFVPDKTEKEADDLPNLNF
jgi:ubiquitin-protein ligase